MTISEDEKLKAVAHGILLGCALPVVAYNVAAGRRHNYINVFVYAAFVAFEVYNIYEHVQTAKEQEKS